MGDGTATISKVRRRRIIERPRLTRLLDESQGRIKMLVAPAGYGKTTLARQWLAGKQATWYTATPASADVAALAAGLRDAVAQVVPGAGDALIERLSVTARPETEVETLRTMLAQDLAEWPLDSWLVFDDYQALAKNKAAESFVEGLLADAPLRALFLSRSRPAWASSRRILYGEIFEVDRPLLAMDDEEALAVLDATGDEQKELVEVAQGWPAVLGLAAASDLRPRDVGNAPQLYDFLADEIFSTLSSTVRRRLCELALFDTKGRTLAVRQLAADEARRVLSAGVGCGLLAEQPGGGVELHPLARSFLQAKLKEDTEGSIRAAVDRAVMTLLAGGVWDEAYGLIKQFDRIDLLAALISCSMDDLLTAGRTVTLREWIDAAPSNDPVVLLATAELAFREGRFYESEALSLHAAGELDNHDLAARALVVAGRAAHVCSREPQARRYFGRAQQLAADPKLSRRAAFGELVAAIELEEPSALDLLQALSEGAPTDPSDEVILADRHLVYQTRFGTPVDLQRGREAGQLLRFVRDPVARASFRNMLGYSLASTGHWEDAVAVTEEQLRDAERCRLEFVVPYALSLHAMVSTGLRQYDRCSELLADAEKRARKSGDLAALQMVAAVRMRSLIAQARFEEALVAGDVALSSVTRSLHGEILSVRALSCAALGRVERARGLAAEGLGTSVGVETSVNANCALAVAALSQSEHARALEHAAEALGRVNHTGMLESLMCAYRGCPQLVVCLLQRRDLHEPLEAVLRRAGDDQLLAAAGGDPSDKSILSLSPREKEVLALLAQGMSNIAIGRTLFISPVTVKVHVRHIFEKLGVKSRAEAALRAAQLGRD
jgi:LuxR family transcriptional regulator, maltose regulon positive regulatory protein